MKLVENHEIVWKNNLWFASFQKLRSILEILNTLIVGTILKDFLNPMMKFILIYGNHPGILVTAGNYVEKNTGNFVFSSNVYKKMLQRIINLGIFLILPQTSSSKKPNILLDILHSIFWYTCQKIWMSKKS